MVSRRKLNQRAEQNSQSARTALSNFKPVAPATPNYPYLGDRVMAQPQGLSLQERDEMRTKLNNTTPKQMIQDANARFRGGQQSAVSGNSFNSAFAAARKQGLNEFEWNGKRYGTQLAQANQAPKSNAPDPTYEDSMRRGVIPQVVVTASRPKAIAPGWGDTTGPYRPAGSISPTRGFDNKGAYSTSGGSFTNTLASNPNYETAPQTRRLSSTFRFPGVASNKDGGKLKDKQKEFVAYLIQASGVNNDEELNEYIQDLGQDGLEKEFEKFEELMTQGTEQVQAAAKGAKLNYIKALRGQCPDGFEMQYFKKGGVMCSKCIKKAQAQKAPSKAEKGTKVVQDFRSDMKKCGGKMAKKTKKKEQGGSMAIPGVIDTKKNKLSPKGKVQIKKHYFGGKL